LASLPTLSELEAAIFQEEGGTSAAGYAQNNPGDLMTNQGTLESYPTIESGENALTGYLQNAASGTNTNYYPGETLGEFETTYTGGDTSAAANVGSILGVDPATTPLASIVANNDLGGGSPASLMQQLQETANQEPTLPGGYGVNVSPSGTVTATGMGTTETAQANSQNNWLTDGVAILIGAILIAGAVFGFRELTTTVIEGAKKGAVAAASA
jgi:hypothetical protein